MPSTGLPRILPRILGVAKDPAGAEVVWPVLAQLQQSGAAHCQAAGQAHAVQILPRAGVPVDALGPACEEDALASCAAALLDAHAPDLVIAGTSKGASIDKHILEAAARRGIPSLTVLDCWINFWQRFSGESPEERFRFLPSAVAAIDDYCVQAMKAEGFPQEMLHVTGPGTPYLDPLAQRAQGSTSRQAQLRRELGLDEDEFVILFASQPLSTDYGASPEAPGWLGYSEHSAFADLLQALSFLDLPKRARLVLKLHPREDAGSFEAMLRQCPLPLTLDTSAPPRDMLEACDLVLGMTTIMLVEAVLMGRPTLSYQPPSTTPDPLAFVTKSGACALATTPEQLQAALKELLRHRGAPPAMRQAQTSLLVDGGATARVASLALRLLGSGEG